MFVSSLFGETNVTIPDPVCFVHWYEATPYASATVASWKNSALVVLSPPASTVGGVASYVLVKLLDGVLVLLAASEATAALTLTVTCPSAVGLTKNVYVEALAVAKSDTEPFKTPMSDDIKLVTLSEKAAVTLKDVLVGSGALVESVTVGLVVSILMFHV